jgi:quinol monooxygenase YgiN
VAVSQPRQARATQNNNLQGRKTIMTDMDRRALFGAAALGGVAAAIFTSSAAEAAGDNSGYFVIAEIVTSNDRAEELRALLVPYADKSATEPGCQKYVLMEVITEPGRFLTYERWTNKAALDAHMTTPDIKEVVPKIQPLLTKPISQIFLEGRAGV